MQLESFQSGKTYQDLPKVRVIAFLNFILREDNNEIVQPIKLMYTKEPMKVATDKLAYYNVEVPKFKAEYKLIDAVSGAETGDNALLQWLYMLTKGYQSEEEMDMLKEKTVGMANFTNLYTLAIADQELRDRYEYEMSQILDENSRMRAAEEKGLAAGRAEGRAEGRVEGRAEGIQEGKDEQAKRTATILYKRGDSPSDIAEIVGYTVETIKHWVGLLPA